MSDRRAKPFRKIAGEARIPGDKSISHRSVMLGSLATGTTRVRGFLPGDDPLATIGCFEAMGVKIERPARTELVIHGVGLGGLKAPTKNLDVGNSGTTIRLLSGIMAAQPFDSVLDGDASIRRRPMGRVMEPLAQMGAQIEGIGGKGNAPLRVRGLPKGKKLKGVTYKSPVASAQVKSALLLAGLYAEGETVVLEPAVSRDHTERMFAWMGVETRKVEGGVSLRGGQQPKGRDIEVPSDISSAAFLIVAALLAKEGELLLKDVGVNPTRDGIVEVLCKMGGKIEVLNPRERSGEPVADLKIQASRLKAGKIGGAVVPRLIDEIPVLAVAAAFAEGETVISDAQELRVKESDRIATMGEELGKLGIQIEPLPDGMKIRGNPERSVSGGRVDSHGDHRVAMSLAVCGAKANGEIEVGDTACVETSFPGFFELLSEVSA
ncbi:MAG: 3-phosphoshikimate 1-carboxyvinyltransferase [Bdellovibrionota bacterium]